MLDIERLRTDLSDYYGTGALSGLSAMSVECLDIQYMSDEQLVCLAERSGFDIEEYID